MATISLAALAVALLPLARGQEPRDHHAMLAGGAVALGASLSWDFLVLAAVPLLLLDRRRLAVFAAICILGLVLHAPLGTPEGGWPLLVPVVLPTAAVLVGYVRMRRRGVMARDRHARLLAGIVAAQAVAIAATQGQRLTVALLLAGLALPALWRLGGLPARWWWLGLAALAALRLAHLG